MQHVTIRIAEAIVKPHLPELLGSEQDALKVVDWLVLVVNGLAQHAEVAAQALRLAALKLSEHGETIAGELSSYACSPFVSLEDLKTNLTDKVMLAEHELDTDTVEQMVAISNAAKYARALVVEAMATKTGRKVKKTATAIGSEISVLAGGKR